MSQFGTDISSDDIVDNLSFFDSWEDRYKYIIDLGKSLPALPDALKTEDRFVRGCQSQVWLADHYDAAENRLYLAVDSDALIVRGLAAIVLAALNRKSPRQILEYDMQSYFGRLDLLKHLSPTRGNGVQSMVEKIHTVAKALNTA